MKRILWVLDEIYHHTGIGAYRLCKYYERKYG